MKMRHLLPIAACLLAAGGCGNFRDQAALSAGPWALADGKIELGGEMKDTEPFEMTFSPHGNSVVITVGNKVHKGVFELQSDKSPKEIDIKPDATNSEDKAMYGIYDIDADGQGLKMCVSMKKRPKKFETRADNDWVLLRLRRQ
jgi:uncharacterized protein (TIGR03067 family)